MKLFPLMFMEKSKLAAEQFISEKWSNFAILSSIIFGPQTVSPVTKSLPIQVPKLNSILLYFSLLHFFFF